MVDIQRCDAIDDKLIGVSSLMLGLKGILGGLLIKNSSCDVIILCDRDAGRVLKSRVAAEHLQDERMGSRPRPKAWACRQCTFR